MYHSFLKTFKESTFIARSMSKQKKGKAVPLPSVSPEQPVTVDKNGNLRIKIHAKPGAKVNSITDISEQEIGVQISAPPVDGEANSELVKYIASCLGAKKSCVSVEKGNKSRQKTVLVSDSSLSTETVIAKLKENIES
ncbi:UPF0235 protein C15orf40 homolog [Halyomorpha halys]|uniref:UPF0235 protein C15orf40 homolog n=1 Tax=Halyomorpha halys TaxID=286706 RepID=UPI0006D51794|nr:uncharacterized protein LOC106678749 [Halyomorpha halys]